ncbi:MAG: class I SAM-dependent methyltransferase [Patescibacteria group bacterium]
MIYLTSQNFKEYELLDTGAGERLERWGNVILRRPDPQIIWERHQPNALWEDVHAHFNEKWDIKKPLPEPWLLDFENIKLLAKLTNFKHTGVFPEQSANWEWLAQKGAKRVLNLFAYTGAATIVLAKQGCLVTHVDASKPALDWAAENQKLNGLLSDSIRWMLDDAVKFVKREVRRGAQYDGILLDPPSFGHGPSGKLWKFNEDLPGLLADCAALLSPDAKFLLINGYATNSSPLALKNLLEDVMKGRPGTIEYGELCLTQKDWRMISTGIFSRWSP